MSLADAFIPAEEEHRHRVMVSTWGHLIPKRGTPHKGFILFTIGEYGQITPIQSRFENVADSPWFWDHQQDYIYKEGKKRPRGAVLRFDGHYVMFKNGKGRFTGKVTTVIRAQR